MNFHIRNLTVMRDAEIVIIDSHISQFMDLNYSQHQIQVYILTAVLFITSIGIVIDAITLELIRQADLCSSTISVTGKHASYRTRCNR